MFTGKSSVGRRLAGKLGMEFVDLDEEIATEAGCPITEIFSRFGEDGFRAIEHRVVARVLPRPGLVISTGGGVVINPENRKLLSRHSCVVWLTATVETLFERFSASRGKPRPLLQVDDPKAKIAELLAGRDQLYAECDIRVGTDGRSVRRVTEEIIRRVTSVDAIHEG